MSESLTAKYRPKELDEVIGQKAVINQLGSFFNSDYLPQAFIFAGIRGVGKTSVARIFASMVSCSGTDLVELDAASNTGVDDVRRIIESTGYHPAVSNSKVYILDECHMISRSGFNALLKTIEEPLPSVYFILVTTEYMKIPDTIKSRCQTMFFKAVSFADIKQYVISIGASEEIAELVASHADGSVRDAVMLFEKITSVGAENVKDVSSLLGIENKGFVETLIKSLLNKDYYTTFTLVESAVASGYDFVRLCRFICKFAVDLAIAKKTSSVVLCEVFGDFIISNSDLVIDIDAIDMFFHMLKLEQDLNYRNDKDIFLAGLIGAFEC